jgi:hypothetical protein
MLPDDDGFLILKYGAVIVSFTLSMSATRFYILLTMKLEIPEKGAVDYSKGNF